MGGARSEEHRGVVASGVYSFFNKFGKNRQFAGW